MNAAERIIAGVIAASGRSVKSLFSQTMTARAVSALKSDDADGLFP
jgi:hypothetical protein